MDVKNLIVYKSNTGFTKRYVDMIERRIYPADVVEIKKLTKKMIVEAKNIFYGGPLKNNVIEGLDKFLKYHKHFENKNIFVFCTGIEPITPDKRQNVIDANGLEFYHVRLYLLPGGMDYSKMSKGMQKMMQLGMKFADKQGQLPEGVSMDMVQSRLETPLDFVSSDAIDRMINVYHMERMKGDN